MSFENRLIARCGEENLKAAKAILKSNSLQSVWRDRFNRICGRFSPTGSKQCFECAVTPGDEAFSACDCPEEKGKNDYPLCAHGAAILMYYGSVMSRHRLSEDAPPVYCTGLKQESFAELVKRCRPATAYLEVEVFGSFPHVPTKWENVDIAVNLYCDGKKYIGNHNNLTKLYFDKRLNVSLRYEDFSLQEQQIIRFLAINGEMRSSHLSIGAETTTEFFHVLIGFQRFFQDGKQITIRAERAVPVLIAGLRGKLTPGFAVDGAVISALGAKLITGRAGCWIGREGEYFFLPAMWEMTFLRNFFRSGEPKLPEGVSREEYLKNFPFPVVSMRSGEPKVLTPEILMDATFDRGEFLLSVDFLYRCGEKESILCRMNSGALVRGDKRFFKRDLALENQLMAALDAYGFVAGTDGMLLSGDDCSEKAAFFLDRVLPEYQELFPGLSLKKNLSRLSRGGCGVDDLEFSCRLLSTAEDHYLIGFRLGKEDAAVDFFEAVKCAVDRREHIRSGEKVLRISGELGRFLRLSGGVIRNVDPVGGTFELPLCNAEYFNSLSAGIPGAGLPEIAWNGIDVENFELEKSFAFNGTLRKYQKEGVSFLQMMTDRGFNPILADEMGLGKTIQLLAFLASRLTAKSDPVLVVSPASLVENWKREAEKFVPGMVVLAPTGAERKKVLSSRPKCDMLVLSYTAVRLAREALGSWVFSYAVLDEAQHIKNPGSGNAKICKTLHARHRIVLSGTPLENSPEDLWSVMDYLQPGMLGTLADFRRRYAGMADDAELREDLAMRVTPFIKRRTKSEVAADLPEKEERIIYCELLPEQRQLYNKILKAGLQQMANFKPGDVRANALIFNTLLRLRQVCCHPELLPDGEGNGIASAKQELLMELLDENIDSSHKVLLFSQFTSMLKKLIPSLDSKGIAYEYLDGSTLHRQKHVDNFNRNKEIMLFLLSIKAGGTGLNLTSADRVIIYDPWWNPAVELQAADRTHRIGQTKSVTTIKLVAKDTVEERIISLQESKRRLFDDLVGSAENGGLTSEELLALLEESR